MLPADRYNNSKFPAGKSTWHVCEASHLMLFDANMVDMEQILISESNISCRQFIVPATSPLSSPQPPCSRLLLLPGPGPGLAIFNILIISRRRHLQLGFPPRPLAPVSAACPVVYARARAPHLLHPRPLSTAALGPTGGRGGRPRIFRRMVPRSIVGKPSRASGS